MTAVPHKGLGFKFYVNTDNTTWDDTTLVGTIVKMVASTAKREKVDLQLASDDMPNSEPGRVKEATAEFDIAYDVSDSAGITGALSDYFMDATCPLYFRIGIPPFSGATPAGNSDFTGWIDGFDLLVDADELIGAKVSVQKIKKIGLLGEGD